MHCKVNEAFHFFFENAGYAYTPGEQSEIAGRVAGALKLVAAEARFWKGYSVMWELDIESTSQEGQQMMMCTIHAPGWVPVAFLGGVDLGTLIDLGYTSHARVVVAELMLDVP